MDGIKSKEMRGDKDMKKYILTIISVLTLLSLCGCTPEAKTEDEIKSDFTDEMKTLSVDVSWGGNSTLPLELESLEIEKRQTNDKDDTVYCDVVMKNDEYDMTASYVLYYNYYDEGGWILDNYEVLERDITPVNGMNEWFVEEYMSHNYGNYTFKDKNFSQNNTVCEFTYTVEEKHEYCSYIGEVVLVCEFYSDEYSATWVGDAYDGNVECVWDIDGKWYAGIEDTKESLKSEKYTIVNIDIASFDGESAYIKLDKTPATVSKGAMTEYKKAAEGQVYPDIYEDEDGQSLVFALRYDKGGVNPFYYIYFTSDSARASVGLDKGRFDIHRAE